MIKANSGRRSGPKIGTHHKPIARAAASTRTLDGIVFDSVFEMNRWAALRLREQAGIVRNLQRQVPYSLTVNGQKVARDYRLDFQYETFVDGAWRVVYEETKQFDTDIQKFRRKIVQALHGINITIQTRE